MNGKHIYVKDQELFEVASMIAKLRKESLSSVIEEAVVKYVARHPLIADAVRRNLKLAVKK